MRTFLFNFKKQFAPLVEAGTKCQTVRAKRKDGRIPVPGDIAKCYTGLRTSSTRLLVQARVVEASPILIDFRERTLAVNGTRLNSMGSDQFARADGFKSFPEMLNWFSETYSQCSLFEPFLFEGYFTKWQPQSEEEQHVD